MKLNNVYIISFQTNISDQVVYIMKSTIRWFIQKYFKLYKRLPQNVNFKKGFLFIHIPKNAGTSLAKVLEIDSPSHYYLRDFEQQLLPEHFQSLKILAIVRNPWDRFVSLYNYARMEISHYHNNIEPEKSIYGVHDDYELLKDASINACAHFLKEGALRHSYPYTQWNTQSKWLKNKQGHLVSTYFLGRMENVNEDVSALEELVGSVPSLPYVNRSKKVDYHDVLDPETKEIVTRYYEEDIDNFKYTY